MAHEANGTPLSRRIACGRPYSQKAASEREVKAAVLVLAAVWQRSSYRLSASIIVNGSMLVSVLRTEPALRIDTPDLVGTSSMRNGLGLRRGTPLVRQPSRFNISPIVLPLATSAEDDALSATYATRASVSS